MEKIILVLKSDRTEIKKFEKLLEETNQKFGLAMEKFINFQIACSEAIVNAIVHGNKESEDKIVNTSIEYNDMKMIVHIQDQGSGFDVDALPDPTAEENLMKESGRGIFIIKSLVDEFQCNSSPQGTEYVLAVYKVES